MTDELQEWKAWHQRVLRVTFICIVATIAVLVVAAAREGTPEYVMFVLGATMAALLGLVVWTMHSALYPDNRFSMINLQFLDSGRKSD